MKLENVDHEFKFPQYTTERVIDQVLTRAIAMRLYKASGMTGSEIAEKMGIDRSYFSQLVTGLNHRKWTVKHCNKFMDAIRKGNAR